MTPLYAYLCRDLRADGVLIVCKQVVEEVEVGEHVDGLVPKGLCTYEGKETQLWQDSEGTFFLK